MKKTIIPVLAALTLLAGCVSDYMPPAPQPSDTAATKLAEAATSASHSLANLEGIRKAENPQYQKKLPNARNFAMHQLASIDWNGPIGPIVRKIAKGANYKLQVLGNPPSIPVIISINAKNQTLGHILQNIDYQAGKKAYIYVNSKSRTMQLRYARS